MTINNFCQVFVNKMYNFGNVSINQKFSNCLGNIHPYRLQRIIMYIFIHGLFDSVIRYYS